MSVAQQAAGRVTGWGRVSDEDEDQLVDEVRPEWVPLSDPDFKDQLAAVIPHLRAFGRSLSGSRDLADDLVQETLLKAWAARKRFQAGTNMRAWTFIILRNLFLSRSEEHTSELQSRLHLVCRLLLEKKKKQR